MALDPLSAFAVACNVVQIVEVGCKALSKAGEYRRTSDGSTDDQRRLREVSRTLTNLSSSLQKWLEDPSRAGQLQSEEVRLVEANDECLRLSTEFTKLLDSLKIKDQHTTIESIRMSIKARWYKDRMDAMLQALSEARDNLNIAFLLYMHSHQAAAAADVGDQIKKAHTDVENYILAAVNSSSSIVQQQIKGLAEELKNAFQDELPRAFLASEQLTVASFIATHQNIFEEINRQLESIDISQRDHRSDEAEERLTTARQRVLDSLHFPGLNDRHEQIVSAYPSTYQWILRPSSQRWQNTNRFINWLESNDTEQRIYWINGKAGCGKSTMMKFLDEHLNPHSHMEPWLDGQPIHKASCFFWLSGTTLQKSLAGMYRSLLYQLLENCPEAISEVTPQRMWKNARLSSNSTIDWSNRELRTTLNMLVDYYQSRAKMFVLIDGLDEFQDTDEEHNHLMDFIATLSRHEHVKLCVSSRPTNTFYDTFNGYPKLRLEDLTRGDIQLYTASLLQSSRRWQLYEQHNNQDADDLIIQIISKAAGVFLWVRLVVANVLQGLRDGDTITQLKKNLDSVPPSLDEYFTRMIESIKPSYRREACLILQLALHNETEFVTLHPLRLVDIFRMDEQSEDFVTNPSFNFDMLDFTNREALFFQMDSTLRKVNSRCMGLLDVVERGDMLEPDEYWSGSDESDESVSEPEQHLQDVIGRTATLTIEENRLNKTDISKMYYVRIDFIHRSLRDLLLTHKMQEFLHKHTDGPVNARVFLCSARLERFIALARTGKHNHKAVQIASYLLSALSVNHESPISAVMASIMESSMTAIATHNTREYDPWYIDSSLRSWSEEQSNFLTLAIDFRITSYVISRLTQETIKSKQGRPILDYILRPRFINVPTCNFGNQLAGNQMLSAALSNGADPNQVYEDEGVSVWALFFCLLADSIWLDVLADVFEDERRSYYGSVKLMIEAGAALMLRKSWLSILGWYEAYRHPLSLAHTKPTHDVFEARWPGVVPVQNHASHGSDPLYAVSDLLVPIQTGLGLNIESLIQYCKVRETQVLGSS